MIHICRVLAAALLLWSGFAYGTTLTRSELPSVYQTCPASVPSNCSSSLTSRVDIGGTSVFYDRAFDKTLVRYSTYAPSDGSLTGYLWLAAESRYDVFHESQHSFTLLFDYANPDPRSRWENGREGGLEFTLSTDALLGGEGHSYAECCFGGPYAPGNLTQTQFIPCAADVCTAAIDFYLLNLRYKKQGGYAMLTFDSTDERRLLYRQHSTFYQPGGYPYYIDDTYEYHAVPSVPVPAALWLLMSALGVMVPWQWHRKS